LPGKKEIQKNLTMGTKKKNGLDQDSRVWGVQRGAINKITQTLMGGGKRSKRETRTKKGQISSTCPKDVLNPNREDNRGKLPNLNGEP